MHDQPIDSPWQDVDVPTDLPVLDVNTQAGALEALAAPADRPGRGEPGSHRLDDDYLASFRLRENPFPDALSPAFFYRTDRYEEIVIRMMLAIRHHMSLGLVTGPSGTGKTLVSQIILQELERDRYVPVLVLVSPGMSKTALLREILSELGVAPPDGPFVRAQDLLHELQQHLLERHRRGQTPVIFIDECHFLSSPSLHLLRTLGNLELPERKLMTCLLFGEDRFLRRLAHPSYEALRNRLYFRGELVPMDVKDTAEYVKYRIMAAGRMDPLFDGDALAAIHTASKGIPRRINKVAMLSMMETYLREKRMVDSDAVEAVRDRI